jgi:hypothetical protein
MAMNPMQRRTRNAFLLGLLVAVLIALVIVLVLLYKIKGLNEAKEALENAQKFKYVASQDLVSGQEVTFDMFMQKKVISDVPDTDIVDSLDFEFIDEVTGEVITKIDEEGNQLTKKMAIKISVPAGTIVTKDMLYEVDDPIRADQRWMEYSCISLPSQLVEGEYIDIRYAIPDGQDYIVLSKKKVLQCTATSVWFKMTEDEMLTLASAIVESYINSGIKLYAVQYTEPGMQTASIPTYPVKEEIKELIRRDPNVYEEAKQAIEYRYAQYGQANERNGHISKYIDSYDFEEKAGRVEAGYKSEQQELLQKRQQFLGDQ